MIIGITDGIDADDQTVFIIDSTLHIIARIGALGALHDRALWVHAIDLAVFAVFGVAGTLCKGLSLFERN